MKKSAVPGRLNLATEAQRGRAATQATSKNILTADDADMADKDRNASDYPRHPRYRAKRQEPAQARAQAQPVEAGDYARDIRAVFGQKRRHAATLMHCRFGFHPRPYHRSRRTSSRGCGGSRARTLGAK